MSKKRHQIKASAVLYLTFNDGNKGCFWSRDSEFPAHAGDFAYWYNHLYNQVNKKWKGKVKSYAIFRASNGEKIGDPVIRE